MIQISYMLIKLALILFQCCVLLQGIQGNQPPLIEESNVKVGRYSEEERKERILRYMKKRNQRNFNKTIKVCISPFLSLRHTCRHAHAHAHTRLLSFKYLWRDTVE